MLMPRQAGRLLSRYSKPCLAKNFRTFGWISASPDVGICGQRWCSICREMYLQ